MILTLTFLVLVSPTLSNSLSWRTLKSFGCNERGISPISSRKIVPPSASSNFPILSFMAPLKAPLTCPKSSLSKSPSTMALQLTFKKGLFFLQPSRWTALATSSFPVPLSPSISIAQSVSLRLSINSKICCIWLFLPIMFEKWYLLFISFFKLSISETSLIVTIKPLSRVPSLRKAVLITTGIVFPFFPSILSLIFAAP